MVNGDHKYIVFAEPNEGIFKKLENDLKRNNRFDNIINCRNCNELVNFYKPRRNNIGIILYDTIYDNEIAKLLPAINAIRNDNVNLANEYNTRIIPISFLIENFKPSQLLTLRNDERYLHLVDKSGGEIISTGDEYNKEEFLSTNERLLDKNMVAQRVSRRLERESRRMNSIETTRMTRN